ncbi:hypothetical protein VCHENC01_4672B, partial [Vibrio harveyi]
LSLLI